MGKVTIKMIAEHLNISTATVSKAINNLPGVSEELRAEVREYANKIGYIPNLFGRGLKGKKQKVIGVIITDIANPFYSASIQGIEFEAEKHGYNIFLCSSKENWALEERQINALIQRGVEGIIITPSDCNNKEYSKNRFDILNKTNIPFVLMYRIIEKPGHLYDYIKSDNVHGAYTAIQYLFNKNHKKILFLTINSNISSIVERRQGFIKAYMEYNVANPERNIYYCDDMTFKSAYEMTLQILEKSNDFTAIFTANDIMAFGVIKALLSQGIKVPDEVAVIGHDDNPYASMNVIPLTTVHQESTYFGRRATSILIDKIEGKCESIVQEVSKPTLIVRDSA